MTFTPACMLTEATDEDGVTLRTGAKPELSEGPAT